MDDCHVYRITTTIDWSYHFRIQKQKYGTRKTNGKRKKNNLAVETRRYEIGFQIKYSNNQCMYRQKVFMFLLIEF